MKYGEFMRVDLFPSNAVPFPGAGPERHADRKAPHPNGRVWLAGPTPGPDNSESINYANWYAYYSTRLNAAKSTSATAFSYPDQRYGAIRSAIASVSTRSAKSLSGFGGGGKPIIWLDVNDWDPAACANREQVVRQALRNLGQHFQDADAWTAMMRIGNLVETGGSRGLAASINPLPRTAADPIPDQDLKPEPGLTARATTTSCSPTVRRIR